MHGALWGATRRYTLQDEPGENQDLEGKHVCSSTVAPRASLRSSDTLEMLSVSV